MLQVKLEKPTPENSCLIELSQGKFAVVDRPEPFLLQYFRWIAVRWHFRWYAVSWVTYHGKRNCLAMHRLVAKTPPGEVCHHYNKNSLDNRFANLLNQTPRHHRELHGIRRFGRKNQ